MLTVEEILEFIQEYESSEKYRLAKVGQNYYEGDHDIRNYRMYYYNADGELIEDETRSNIKISHPFFTELVDQKVQYMLSGKGGFIKSDNPKLQQELDEYFNENDEFRSELQEVITGSSSFIPVLQASFERCLGDSNSAAVEEIDARLLELQQELLKMANAKQNYDALANEIDELRAEKEELLLQEANKDGIRQRMTDMVSFLQSEPEEVTEYSEALVRRMIEKITVYDDHFVVEFKSGIEITINE